VCGHPAPGEKLADAVRRRGLDELGVRLTDVRLALPTFRYRARMPDGVVENEMCPVFTALTTDEVDARPEEVDSSAWVDWRLFRTSVLDGSRTVSPWCVEQVRLLSEEPWAEPAVPPDRLPPAARDVDGATP